MFKASKGFKFLKDICVFLKPFITKVSVIIFLLLIIIFALTYYIFGEPEVIAPFPEVGKDVPKYTPYIDENSEPGTFITDVKMQWLRNGRPHRNMRLLDDFAFVTQDKRIWKVPRGWEVDGASIPSEAWSRVGPPYVGNYREPSVIHDYYCEAQTTGYLEVHNMFKEALYAMDIKERAIKSILGAIDLYNACQWSSKSDKSALNNFFSMNELPAGKEAYLELLDLQESYLEILPTSSKEITLEDFNEFMDWIDNDNPTYEQIRFRALEIQLGGQFTDEFKQHYRIIFQAEEVLRLNNNVQIGVDGKGEVFD